MSRPPKSEARKRVDCYFPESVYARLSLLLHSEIEGRVPHGAWSEFITAACVAALDRIAAAPTTKEPS